MRKGRGLKIHIFLKIIFAIIFIILLLLIFALTEKIKEQNEKLENTTWMSEQIKRFNTLEPPSLDSFWKQYQNPYGYQVYYPSDWRLLVGSPGDGYQETMLASPRAYSQREYWEKNKEDPDYDKLSPLIHITAFDSFNVFKSALSSSDIVSGFNLEQIAENLKKTDDSYYYYTSPVAFYIGPNKALSVGRIIKQSKDTSELMVLMENSGLYYLIKFNTYEAITKLSEEEIKILASLKLIEPSEKEIKTQPLTVKNWRDYENEELGFKTKIPDDWRITPENNAIKFASSLEIEMKEWCELQYCEIPNLGERFRITKYDNFDKFKEDNGYQGLGDEVTTVEVYLRNRKKVDYELISYEKIKINKYSAFGVKTGGFCGDYSILIEHQEKVYEIFYTCQENRERLTDIDNQILESFEFL